MNFILQAKTFAIWFWNEQFWLPPNVTWKDLQNTASVKYPQYDDFRYVIPCALLLLLTRSIVERYVARHIAMLMGVQITKTRQVQPNDILEKAFHLSKVPASIDVTGLAKQLDWSSRKIERWFYQRRRQESPKKMDKFAESFWRCLCYSVTFTYGAINIGRQDWFWNISLCWHDLPFHEFSRSTFILYFLELSFYFSLIISTFFDVKRKDAYAMFVHHILTVLLLSLSWICNFTRIGCLIIVLHDCSDVFLEGAKLFNYAKMSILAHITFAGFAISFFLTRIIYFPFWVVYSSTIQCYQYVGYFPSWIVFNLLLVFLLLLHIYWFSFIVIMLHTIILNGKASKDARSDDDESNLSSSDSEGTKTKSNGAVSYD